MDPRCFLFVPGDSERKQEKSWESGADALILDLEDSVAPDAKHAARALTAAFLAQPAPMLRFVRVNALDTGLTEEDVAATAVGKPDGYVLPKCAGRGDIDALSALIEKHGAGDARIFAIATETVRAVRSLMSSDWSHPRLSAMTWGAEDLAADMGAIRNRNDGGRYYSPFTFARDAMLFAALDAGVAAVDSVYTNFRDEVGLIAEARAALDCGFTGKMAIHPAQVAPIQEVFTPTTDQVAWARKVVAAMDGAGKGVVQVDGIMIDRPHVKTAQGILDRWMAMTGGQGQ